MTEPHGAEAAARALALRLHLGVGGAILSVVTVAFLLRECGFGPSGVSVSGASPTSRRGRIPIKRYDEYVTSVRVLALSGTAQL